MKNIFIFLVAIGLLACNNAPKTEEKVQEVAKKGQVIVDTLEAPKVDIDFLMGKFDPSTHADFIKVPAKYTDGARTYYLQKETWTALQKMINAAQQDGVSLKVRSATRNFAAQKRIWEAKWQGQRILSDGVNAAIDIANPVERAKKILEYSSMPGTSRHHWGTDLDLNNFNNAYFEKGKGLKEYEWLVAHAADYGFCQPYSPKGSERPYGYEEEKWHWSYMPLAKPYTQAAKHHLKDSDIQGFLGGETAAEVGLVEKYVLGVAELCR